jgi:hypothetical protein
MMGNTILRQNDLLKKKLICNKIRIYRCKWYCGIGVLAVLTVLRCLRYCGITVLAVLAVFAVLRCLRYCGACGIAVLRYCGVRGVAIFTVLVMKYLLSQVIARY